MLTVEEAQYELNVAIEETIADQFDGQDEVDEGSIASDLFVSLSYDWPPAVAAEVARREFGWVPFGVPQAVADEFEKLEVEW